MDTCRMVNQRTHSDNKNGCRKQDFFFFANQLKELGCPVGIVNGMPDHIHCLFLLNPQKTISEVVKQIKGSRSHFINQCDIRLSIFGVEKLAKPE